jgi:pSer/pThr/pTyr-binding forkhead associated (FHA) protein
MKRRAQNSIFHNSNESRFYLGIIRQGNTQFTLGIHTRIGRSDENDLVLEDNGVSAYHAVLEWTDNGQWQVRDLGSTNGSFLGRERLSSGIARVVEMGDVLRFADNQHWELCDVSPPSLEVVNTGSGERRMAEDGILLLSSDEDNWVEVVQTSSGLWNVEENGRSAVLKNGEVIRSGDDFWKVKLPRAIGPTTPLTKSSPGYSRRLAEAHFRFFVSQDLEHIRLTISLGKDEWISERAHNWLLLQMAKIRIDEEANPSVQTEEAGWIYVDELCTIAGMNTESRVNVEIHRIRKEMSKLGIPEPAAVVERRRGTGKVRIGTPHLKIDQAGN